MSFIYHRTVHFRDTDAAGVIYFANGLAICHEAFEASLAAVGIDLKLFFGGTEVAAPIVHAEIDFRRPVGCGDRLTIEVNPTQTRPSEFEINYQVCLNEAIVMTAQTRHVCIRPETRQRCDLPAWLVAWLQATAGPSALPVAD